MVLARITGIVLILFGIFIGLTYFEIIPDTFLDYNLVVIGIVIFIAHEAFAIVGNITGGTNKIIGIGVPLIFIIIAALYFVKTFLPEAVSSTAPLVTAALMVAEGLYRLH